jgi:hypothetical protein
MKKGSLDKILIALISGGIIGFFVGYAVNYDAPGAGASGSSPVAVAGGAGADIDVKPLRELEPSPSKGGEAPKDVIHENSEFQ